MATEFQSRTKKSPDQLARELLPVLYPGHEDWLYADAKMQQRCRLAALYIKVLS